MSTNYNSSTIYVVFNAKNILDILYDTAFATRVDNTYLSISRTAIKSLYKQPLKAIQPESGWDHPSSLCPSCFPRA